MASEKVERSWWKPAAAVLALLLPFAGSWIGARYAYDSVQHEVGADFVSLAAEILRDPPKREAVDLRKWAADLIDHHSEVKLSSEARRALIDSLPLSSANALPVTLRINGGGAVVILRASESFTYGWSSGPAATGCQLYGPWWSDGDLCRRE